MPDFRNELTYKDILHYPDFNEKGCLRKEVYVSGSIIRRRAPQHPILTDKIEDAA
jgi:hypothetical protein